MVQKDRLDHAILPNCDAQNLRVVGHQNDIGAGTLQIDGRVPLNWRYWREHWWALFAE